MSALAAQTWAARLVAIDASTYAGTVAVLREGRVVSVRAATMRGEHEERLMPAVVEALDEAGVAPSAITAVVCGAGPGSFTSLRIAASIAKGLAYAAAAPLWAVPSLALLPVDAGAPGRVLATLDALRGESYAAIVTRDAAGEVTGYQRLGLVPSDALEAIAAAHGAQRIRTEAAEPHARSIVALGALLVGHGPVDLDAWEPDYGRKAEAQVKWEAAHGRALPVGGTAPS